MYSTVTFAFVLDLADPYDTDFTGIIDVRATAGLIVNVFNADSANVTHTSWWLHGHRPHEFRALVQLDFGDCAEDDRVRLRDKRVDACRQVLFVERMLAEIEIQPALVGADRSARHWHGDERAKQVHAGVHAHVSVTPFPVDRNIYRVTGLQPVVTGVELVFYLLERITFSGIQHFVCYSIWTCQGSRVRGLSTTQRIENCCVEFDPLAIYCSDGCRELFLIAVFVVGSFYT